ncbi:MAG: ABC transporter permease [Euryarchaeota archaeon]|nr:ABC transporter permease [Euryarchaeota archaeon]
MNLLYIALKNTQRKPVRSLVTSLSITLLVAFVMFTLFFLIGVERSIERATDRLGADVVVVPSGAMVIAEEFLLEGRRKTFYMDVGIVEELGAIEGVEKVTYHVYVKTMPGICCDVEAIVVGFDPDTDFVVTPWLEKSGVAIERGEVVLGSTIARDIGYGLFDTGTFFYQGFRIAGVLEETGTGMDRSIFVPLEDIKELAVERGILEENKISVVFLKLREGYEPRQVARKIEGMFPQVDAVARGRIGEEVRSNFREMGSIFVFSVLLLAVFALFLSWAMFSAVASERVKEIGVLRAIGAKRSHIFNLIILEAAILSLAGGLAGLLLGGAVVSRLMDRFTLLASVSPEPGVAAVLVLLSFLSGVSLCIAGALLPALRISRMEPLSALKDG